MNGIQFSELLDYTHEEMTRWKQWFARNASALDLPIDIADAGTVRHLVQHIFSVELHFANIVLGLPPANLESLEVSSVDELFGIGERATKKYRQFIARAESEDWSQTIDLGPRLNMKPSKRKLVSQALTHSIRHWAQLSTFLRQQGLKQDWNHDFLLSKAME